MTAVDSSETGKRAKRKRGNSKRKRDKKKFRSKVRLAKRLEKYRKIFEETRAARAKQTNQFRFDRRLPGEFLEISSKLVTSANYRAQPPSSPFFINPQQAMSGNCFWLNYQSVFHWKDQHMHNIPEQLSLPDRSRQKIIPSTPPILKRFQETNREADWHQGDKHYLPAPIPESEYYETDGSTDTGRVQNSEQNEGAVESDDDIVVTEEMMQFLEISMRHKANREREKQAAKELERKKRIEERDIIEDCQVPSEEDENEKRLREMSELYGTDAPKIHGMETALQLNFNRQLDLFNPSYWPFYPFSMQFKGVTALK